MHVKWDRTKGRPEPIRLLNRVRELENGDPLVPMADFCPSVKIERPQVIAYLRQPVAEMLEKANQNLPKGYHLTTVDAWRPFNRQKRIWEFMWRSAKEVYPNRDDIALKRTVCRWVAPIDQKAPPGHCTGAAVDVWLVDDHGELIDVASPYDRWHAAPTYAFGLTDEARRNRDILVETMLGVGFSNCRDEWWHYSYGDAGWAVRMDKKECFYGLVELPFEMYAELEKEHEESMKDRPNPFLPPA